MEHNNVHQRVKVVVLDQPILVVWVLQVLIVAARMDVIVELEYFVAILVPVLLERRVVERNSVALLVSSAQIQRLVLVLL